MFLATIYIKLTFRLPRQWHVVVKYQEIFTVAWIAVATMYYLKGLQSVNSCNLRFDINLNVELAYMDIFNHCYHIIGRPRPNNFKALKSCDGNTLQKKLDYIAVRFSFV